MHQLGFGWRDGSLSARVGAALLGFGAVGLASCLLLGPYPVSMVGLPGDTVSNMAPPTFALLCQGLALIGAVALAREPAQRVLRRPRVWYAVAAAGRYAMTAFLWHLTALMLVILALRALGVRLPEVGSGLWWATRPLWFVLLAVPTAGLVALFVRWDRAAGGRGAGGRGGRDRGGLDRGGTDRGGRDRGASGPVPAWADPLAALAVATLFLGILMVSIAGVDVLGGAPQFFLVGEVTPAYGCLVVGGGLALLELSSRAGR